MSSKFLDPSDLVRRHQNTPVALPGVLGESHNGETAEQAAPDEPEPTSDTVTAVDEKPADAEPESAAKGEAEPEATPAAAKAKTRSSAAAPKATTRAKTATRPGAAGVGRTTRKATSATKATRRAAPKEPPAEETSGALDELESLDGRPARLWETSKAAELPEGWARESLRRVAADARENPSMWVKANILLPDEVHAAALKWLADNAVKTGERYALTYLWEAAFEQLPDDPDDWLLLLKEVPDKYLAANVIKPKSNRLRSDTAEVLSLIPLQLRARGLSRHTGRLHVACVLRIYKDLGIEL